MNPGLIRLTFARKQSKFNIQIDAGVFEYSERNIRKNEGYTDTERDDLSRCTALPFFERLVESAGISCSFPTMPTAEILERIPIHVVFRSSYPP